MSVESSNTQLPCQAIPGVGAITMIIRPEPADLGDFSVRRALPNSQCTKVGPWIFFDHMGPAQFLAGQGINVRPHPHINLATVTYLFEGEILHRDSLGSYQPIRPGDVNLMVAGRGIVHSERELPEVRCIPHKLHGLQLWLALPNADEEMEPAFYHYPAEQIPTVNVGGVKVRVIMGSAYGVTSPVRTFANTLYAEAHLQKNQTLRMANAQERALYVVTGQLNVAGEGIQANSLAILNTDNDVIVRASRETHLALIGGAALPHRFIEWNFVSSRRERIARAMADWSAHRFPKVPGDTEEYIPLPDRDRSDEPNGEQ